MAWMENVEIQGLSSFGILVCLSVHTESHSHDRMGSGLMGLKMRKWYVMLGTSHELANKTVERCELGLFSNRHFL